MAYNLALSNITLKGVNFSSSTEYGGTTISVALSEDILNIAKQKIEEKYQGTTKLSSFCKSGNNCIYDYVYSKPEVVIEENIYVSAEFIVGKLDLNSIYYLKKGKYNLNNFNNTKAICTCKCDIEFVDTCVYEVHDNQSAIYNAKYKFPTATSVSEIIINSVSNIPIEYLVKES